MSETKQYLGLIFWDNSYNNTARSLSHPGLVSHSGSANARQKVVSTSWISQKVVSTTRRSWWVSVVSAKRSLSTRRWLGLVSQFHKKSVDEKMFLTHMMPGREPHTNATKRKHWPSFWFSCNILLKVRGNPRFNNSTIISDNLNTLSRSG